MTASEIVTAYEDGVITENEATEQGLVETLDDLYSRLSVERRMSDRGSRAHAGSAR